MDCCSSFKDRCIDRLRDQGNRITHSRVVITECLESFTAPFTAKQVHQELASNGHGELDFATVYRTLQTYSDLELIHPIGQTGKFIRCNSEHICDPKLVHVIYRCEKCEGIEENQLDPELVGSIFFLTKQINPTFKSKSIVIDLNGRCQTC